MNHNRRRRKQRPNYGRRMIEVCRSVNGFGFTISGQQPCIMSCIVPNSPADTAGLRAGDFLISVNGLNVSKLPHELVVQLINKTPGTIRLSIAENYYSDSSDDDNNFWAQNSSGLPNGTGRTRRTKYPHHKLKSNKSQQLQGDKYSPKKSQSNENIDWMNGADSVHYEITEDCSPAKTSAHNIIHSPNASNDKDISNVSAMVPPLGLDNDDNQFQLEYRAVVGYLGTIEMPKQIATSSKLQTVRSCIRKMRQEKRQPTVVLMQILPKSLKLYNAENALIAKYPSNRLIYVSSNSLGNAPGGSNVVENDTRFFGLVTSSAFIDGTNNKDHPSAAHKTDNVISNSCHVFVIDMKLIEHATHFHRAEQFSIVCTTDPISNCCLEFPSSSEYVVNLIRSMYSLNSCSTPAVAGDRSNGVNKRILHELAALRQPQFQPHNNGGHHSPQPSNHSEVTTASSNSDSGIGFHNDFTNISDRIVVVDFPGRNHQMLMPHMNVMAKVNVHSRMNGRPMPFGAGSVQNGQSMNNYDQQPSTSMQQITPVHAKSKSLDFSATSSPLEQEFVINKPDLRLIRAMPDPKSFTPGEKFDKQIPSPVKYETIYGGHLINNNGDYQKNSPFQERAIDVPVASESKIARELSTQFSRGQQWPSHCLPLARSCDNLMMNHQTISERQKQQQASYDDVSLLGEAPPPPIFDQKGKSSRDTHPDDHVFATPQQPKPVPKKSKSSTNKLPKSQKSDQLLSYKLSPKVFGVKKPSSISGDKDYSLKKAKKKPCTKEKCDELLSAQSVFHVWGSLQNLPVAARTTPKKGAKVLEPAFSEPDLTVSIALRVYILFYKITFYDL